MATHHCYAYPCPICFTRGFNNYYKPELRIPPPEERYRRFPWRLTSSGIVRID